MDIYFKKMFSDLFVKRDSDVFNKFNRISVSGHKEREI